MRTIKAAIAGILSLLVVASALAQGVPSFPQTLPANTVVGRLGIGPGPSQAIPIDVFQTQVKNASTILLSGVTAKLRAGTPIVINWYGDSKTAGYQPPSTIAPTTPPQALFAALNGSGNVTVNNLSQTGDTSGQGLTRWTSIRSTADAVIIDYATNDANLNVGVNVYYQNITKFIQWAIKGGSAVIVLGPDRMNIQSFDAGMRPYIDAARTAASVNGVPFVDLNQQIGWQPSRWFSSYSGSSWDGTHLASYAYNETGAHLAAIFFNFDGFSVRSIAPGTTLRYGDHAGYGGFETDFSPTLTTSAATSAGSNVLTFPSIPPWLTVGLIIKDSTTNAAIPVNTFVQSMDATHVYLNNNVTSPGVGSGDTISATSQLYSLTTGNSITFGGFVEADVYPVVTLVGGSAGQTRQAICSYANGNSGVASITLSNFGSNDGIDTPYRTQHQCQRLHRGYRTLKIAQAGGNTTYIESIRFVAADGPVTFSFGNATTTLPTGARAANLTNALTAGQALVLPPANSYAPNTKITFTDAVGGISSAFPLVLTATGSDVIRAGSSNGSTFAVRNPGATFDMIADGISRWTISVPSMNCAQIVGSATSCGTDATNASNIASGTLPTGRLAGSYTGITGVGTLAAGSVPVSLLTDTAWATYTPTVTPPGGDTASATGHYRIVGKQLHISIDLNNTAGTTGGNFTVSLPSVTSVAGISQTLSCTSVGTGQPYGVVIAASSTTITVALSTVAVGHYAIGGIIEIQ